MKSISLIVPLYNERDSLQKLHGEIAQALEKSGAWCEIIFIDDGSDDGSFEVLRELQDLDSRIKLVRFRRNFGKSAALSAGFRLAKGDVVVTLDADLQDQPVEIVKLTERLEEGYDLVSGWKQNRRDPFSRRLASRIFNAVTSLLTGVPLHDINCGLKAYRRQVIEEIQVYGEMHRYIPVLASYRGFRVGEIPVGHRARRFGKSKFGLGRYAGGFFDLLTVMILTRYNKKPLHVFGILGVISFLIGLIIEVYLSAGWLFGEPIANRPLFLLGILLLIIGVQFIFFGLLAEMIAYTARREDDYSVCDVRVVESGEVQEGSLAASAR